MLVLPIESTKHCVMLYARVYLGVHLAVVVVVVVVVVVSSRPNKEGR